jgi:hypothetical protein
VVGDANITSAMNTVDCNQYGWDPQWSGNPTIDPNGVVSVNGEKEGVVDANTVVGYFKLHYNGTPVTVTAKADSLAYDANNIPVRFSPMPLTICYDPNQGSGSPVVYLTYDGNNPPDANSDLTIHVYSDVLLSSMEVGIEISGDAIITSAMDANDCEQYGWDSGWWSSSEIDPNGMWAYTGNVAPSGGTSGTVGYFTVHYNSGTVTIAPYYASAYDVNSQPAMFSTDTIVLGGESMQGGQQLSMMQTEPEALATGFFSEQQATSIEEPAVDIDSLVKWCEELWNTDAEIRASMTEAQWQEFIDSIKSSQ